MSLRFLGIIFIVFITLFPQNAKAEKVARWYKISWKSLYIADFKVEFDESGMTSEIQSRGAVKAVSKYSNRSSSTFHKEGETYLPTLHYSYLTQRQGDKKVVINFNENGSIKNEAVTPPDKPSKRPPVKQVSKIGASDPLTAALIAHEKIRLALAKGEKNFSFNSYDGRRLSRLEFIIEGKHRIKVLDKNEDVVKINFRRVALEGFTKNELKRMMGEEPDITIYLGEKDLLPLSANATAPLGKAVFTLVKECKSIETCK